MQVQSEDFIARAADALSDTAASANRRRLGLQLPAQREAAVATFGAFQSLRDHVESVRRHTLQHLDTYLDEFEQQALENGNQVHFARNGEELNQRVLSIIQRHSAKRVAKGKSMVTEETGLNAALEAAGLRVTETDLGEYIVQQAGEQPSHIVAPALHKPEADIRSLFYEKHPLGARDLDTAEDMVAEARRVLREEFLAADIGIIGANALVAESGYSMLVTNEGNGDLCANLPPVLVICTTVDRLLPRLSDAMSMLRLLVRSTTGQPITSYTSFYSGPARDGDIDGPRETHIVLLDNGRSDILASDYRSMLQCIRCGACLNHCPVYVAAGGHAYGSVYPGPMGSVLTPLLTSLEESHTLPNACTSCGRCEEVCPANIPLPQLLRDLRHAENEAQLLPTPVRLGLKAHAWLVQRPQLYRWLSGLFARSLSRLGRTHWLARRVPGMTDYLNTRDLPMPAKETFLAQLQREAENE
ncbi:LutB/LldF family L-lactate oxidation iron-sulfur protein [Halioglobus pacificus]|uniref:Iron-sulfur cluster-binding protein n=1 Tax=Parahalioglobus pacificus TaxID=930806 RepID=A0A918XHQ4_9GAMM|nr:LutB/LldF family L-lactate oxidation iron-sulfur protein [Halioglobus pacificus]GHD31801.1 iron-sulfur cluster-binding protein [Halioglobus pacificus]